MRYFNPICLKHYNGRAAFEPQQSASYVNSLFARQFLPGLVIAALFFAQMRIGAQSAYRVVADWPQKAGRDAPGYGTRMVTGVATDARGQVYVFQRTPDPVLVFDRQGRFLRAWGQGQFTLPHACRIDRAGNVWFTDVGRHQVCKYAPEGRLLQSWGIRDTPGSDARHFNQPADVAWGPGGDIYIADGYGNARVVHLDAAGRYIGAWGRRGTGPGQFRLVHSVAVDAQGRVYVIDRANRRIQIFTGAGKFLTQWTQVGDPFGLFLTPDQRLFVADGIANTVSVYSVQSTQSGLPDGRRLAHWGGTGTAPGKMRRAHLLCVDDQGAVYVAEVDGKRVQKWVPASASPIRK